ncbi:MAG: 2OG-Fe(II) oxygenase [Saprospiraceae bacterium]|nr:2OG-Fe(II) oxygenase [Saprospiraceae bacterium]
MSREVVSGLEQVEFEALIEGLLNRQYGVSDHFLQPPILRGLQQNLFHHLNLGNMNPAGIGRKFDHKKNTLVRGDLIKWIENDSIDSFERLFLEKISRFISYLNETCYTGLNDLEFHYASYASGSFYKRHLDQFQSDKGRKFSLVLYLNADWKIEDGGHLTLYLDNGEEQNIFPNSGRLVFFRSDATEHEVHASFNRSRISIAGWLKCV